MKELPILFSTEMVQAILREVDPKTQTRRVIMPQPPPGHGVGYYTEAGRIVEWVLTYDSEPVDADCPQPRYQGGDHLWVKETYSLPPTGKLTTPAVWYKADNNRPTWAETNWKSGRFMFKKYARIWLEVTGVRAERVQVISYEDILAEGWDVRTSKPFGNNTKAGEDALAWYQNLWDKLNARRGYGWGMNPWVFTYTFGRLDKSEAFDK